MYAVRNLRAPIKRKLSSKFSPRFFSSQSIGIESESSFHVIADRKLEEIMESISVVEDAESCSDINFSQGVLKIDLGQKGCWVINKQTPNRQIWWSSPISGPLRYEYNGRSWHESRNPKSLTIENNLRAEILKSVGIDILISPKTIE